METGRNGIGERLRAKLQSRAGESISETLVAMLVAALALTMLAGAITTSRDIIMRTRERLDVYYTAANQLAAHQTGEIVSGSAAVQIREDASQITFVNENNGVVNVTYYKNQEFEKTPVVAYE